MGNTSASQKDRSASAPQAAKDLNDLLPALRERFEELAGLPAAPVPAESRADEVSAQRRKQQQQPEEGAAGAPPTAVAASAGGVGDGREQEERFVMFDDWSELTGPRGAQLAKRLYGVLDADGDGKLDFEVRFCAQIRLLLGSAFACVLGGCPPARLSFRLSPRTKNAPPV